MSNYKFYLVEKKPPIAWVYLNRPEQKNAMNSSGWEETVPIFEDIDRDDAIRAVIITGKGSCFCVGLDLANVEAEIPELTEQKQRGGTKWRLIHKIYAAQEGMSCIERCQKPVIAAIHGYCIGGGLDIAVLCDLVIGAEDCKFGRSEQKLGFAGSGFTSMQIMMASIGVRRTVELCLTGRTMDGREAERIGLINKAVPKEKLEESVEKLAGALCLLPKDGIAIGKATRHLVYAQMGLTNLVPGYFSHTLFTNLKWEEGELNFFKERRDTGAREAFHKRDAMWAEALKGIWDGS